MKKFCFIYLLFIQSAFSAAAGIGDELDEKLGSFERFHKENYQEVLYVHLDKEYYLAGETIKFKVFCLERLASTPSKLSRVAYLEILDTANTAQAQAKIELINGTGFGELYIPTSVKSGNFVLRGYTRWMRNFGAQSYFHTILPIINPFKKLGLPPIASREELEIDFYPETGALINGVETNVVYAIKDQSGNSVNIPGRIMANDSILVEELHPAKHGIGKVSIKPNIFLKYHVELFSENGDTTKHVFPATTGKGLTMHVTDQQNEVTINVFCNDPSIIHASENLSLIVYQKGDILESYNLKMNKGRAAAIFDKSQLNDGSYNLTLFNENGELLVERAMFKYTENSTQYLIEASVNRLAPREKVTLDLSSMLSATNLDSIELSLTMSTSEKRIGNQALNLRQYLLIDNSLSGVTGKLGEYFQGESAEVEDNINNLLIIEGNNRSQRQLFDNQENPKYIPEYRRPIVTGKITDKQSGEPIPGVLTYLSIPGKNIRFYTSRSRSGGILIFEIDDFYGGNEIVVQNDYTKDTTYLIEIDYPFSREYLEVDLPALDIDEELAEWIRDQSQNMQVEFAYQQFKPKMPTLSKVDSSSFYYEPDRRYFLDDYTRFVVMEEVLREYVAGINVRHNRDGFHFMTIDEQRNLVYEDNPLMLLDGIPIFDADEIIALDPLKIEKIETVRQRFHKGYLDCKGIVTFTTYDGDLAGHNVNRNALSFEYEGIQTRKQYSYPVYNTAFEKNSTIPDFRNTLYWKPDLQINANGSKQIDIFTSDYQADYGIRVEGIGPDGKVVSAKLILPVSGNPNP